MDVSAIDVGQCEIAPGHLHVGVSQQRLQREDIAAIPQLSHSKGVPETMGMHIRHPGTFP
jgi:hypothetical protein